MELRRLCRNCIYMDITISIDDAVVRRARERAKAMGRSLNQLIREYLEQLAGQRDPESIAAEFERLSWASQGDSRGWKFDREELHERQ